jgi:hypothetical protein
MTKWSCYFLTVPKCAAQYLLYSRFSSVTFFTQHLAIRRVCFTAGMPRVYMVALHLFILKKFFAIIANAVLPLVCLAFHIVAKGANV